MLTSKKFLAIIPAKKKSFRIPNKNFIKFKGKTLVENTIETAKRSKFLNYIYLSTDSKKIQLLGKKYNLTSTGLRPKKYSGKLTTMHSVVKYEISRVKENFDYIVVLQPTSPFRSSKDIDNACKKIVNNTNADCLVSCTKLPENYYPGKIMVKNKKFYEFLDLSAIFLNNIKLSKLMKFKSQNFRKKHEKKDILYFRNGAIYITKKNRIKDYIIGGKILNYEMPLKNSLDINNKDDLKNLTEF